MMTIKEQLFADFDFADQRMRELVGTLDEAQLDVPYEPGINPPVWEMGHAAFFFEYFLLRELYGGEPRMPGYDEIWDSFEIPHRERWSPGVVPGKAETLDYYRRVIDETRNRLGAREELSPDEVYLTTYCIAHLCMHLESLIWARQTLGYPTPSFAETWTGGELATSLGDAEIPGGDYFIGVPKQSRDEMAGNFCFDNEKPGFTMRIEPFAISKTLVSCGEYLGFVEDGGYENADHWTFGGKHWLRESGAKHPVYWEKRDDEWWVRRFDQWAPLSNDAPVIHVNFREAEAYCQWAGRRLPSEFEWEIAARGPVALKFPWGDSFEPNREADLDLAFSGTAPTSAFPESASPFGCLQMLGSCWEWTTSQYLPFAGFEADMYAYMSTLQFGDHKTTRGGSFATSANLIRSTYRQAYFPTRRDIFIGFRTCA
ncbi:MAG: SUMF1/EgtB/PvdO family nonheme iron enzyme [Verrucomicrobiota bacterium]